MRVGDVAHQLTKTLVQDHKRRLYGNVFFFCENIGGHIAVQMRAVAQLLGDDRGKSREGGVQCLVQRHGFLLHFSAKRRIVHRVKECVRVFFILGMGNEIFPAGKHLAHRAYHAGNMLDAVDDLILVVAEDNIAVLAHDLNDERLAAEISQLVQVLQFEVKDTLQSRLGDVDDPCVLKVLAQKHAEPGRRHGAGLAGLCKVHKRQGCVCGKQKFILGTVIFDREKKLVVFGLCDLVDPPALNGIS